MSQSELHCPCPHLFNHPIMSQSELHCPCPHLFNHPIMPQSELHCPCPHFFNHLVMNQSEPHGVSGTVYALTYLCKALKGKAQSHLIVGLELSLELVHILLQLLKQWWGDKLLKGGSPLSIVIREYCFKRCDRTNNTRLCDRAHNKLDKCKKALLKSVIISLSAYWHYHICQYTDITIFRSVCSQNHFSVFVSISIIYSFNVLPESYFGLCRHNYLSVHVLTDSSFSLCWHHLVVYTGIIFLHLCTNITIFQSVITISF